MTDNAAPTWLCWHLPDGDPSRGDEVQAYDAKIAAIAFATQFFDDSTGEWMGGDVMVVRLDANLDAVGSMVRHSADVSFDDDGATVVTVVAVP